MKSFGYLLLLVPLTWWACKEPSPSAQTTPNSEQTTATNDTLLENPYIDKMYEGPERLVWQKPELVIGIMGDLNNKTVADLGAGTGYFALRLAPLAKKVIAIDINDHFLNYIDSVKVMQLPTDIQPRLETRLAKPDDPMLNTGEADVVLIVNTFMFIQDKVGYLRSLLADLPSGGKVIVIDFKRKRTPLGPPAELRIPLYLVEEFFYQAGYRNIQTIDTALEYQYIVIAEK
ncbi:MAG: class I SAM-dependent methyltransferase [Lewinella sp.]|nr:class I SAM-dependent methyltransferase [Lewinella sp.]